MVKLQGSQRNSLAAFGRNTVSIRAEIDQYYASGKFHKKPLGPMGMVSIMFECCSNRIMQIFLPALLFRISKKFLTTVNLYINV